MKIRKINDSMQTVPEATLMSTTRLRCQLVKSKEQQYEYYTPTTLSSAVIVMNDLTSDYDDLDSLFDVNDG